MSGEHVPSDPSGLEPLLRPVLAESPVSDRPELLLLLGGPGAPPEQATGQLIGAFGGQLAVISTPSLRALVAGDNPVPDEHLTRSSLALALAERRSVLLEDVASSSDFEVLAREFHEAGFEVRLIVTVGRETETLLAALANRLRSSVTGTLAPSADTHDAGWATTEATLSELVTSGTLDRVMVLDGDGRSTYDGIPAAEVLGGFRQARAGALSGLQGVAWLSELRRMTEYVSAARAGEDLVLLRRLYDVAIETVLPQLPVRPTSPAAVAQRDRLVSERRRIQKMLQSQPGAGAAGAAPGPSSPDSPAL